VYDGETCSGTGEERRCTSRYHSVTDYDTKCDYTADRWGYSRSQTTTGENKDDPPPYWATPDYETCRDLGCERAGRNIEHYTVSFVAEDRPFDCEFSQGYWSEYRTNDRYSVDVGTFIHHTRCDTLKRIP